MSSDDPSSLLVHYYQLTLGPAHLARVKALDRVPGFRCRGVAFAAKERTRRFDGEDSPDTDFDELTTGVYEEVRAQEVLRAAKRNLIERSPSAIIIDSPADFVQYRLGRWAQRRGIRVLTRWAATWLDHPRVGWKEFLKGFVYRRWDGYLITGDRAHAYLERFGVPSSKMFVCGNPVDGATIESIAAEAAPVDRGPDLFFAGRFLRLKNLVPFLEAYSIYRREGGQLGLRIAGFGEDEDRIRAQVSRTSGVQLLGHLQFSELVREYLRCAALVLPSYSENWGLVVNEAMHAGAPVLASTHVGCVPELLEEGKTGLLFDPLSEASMVAALHRFEALPHDERVAMSAACRSRIAEHTPDAWAASVAAALSALAGRTIGE